MIRALLVGEVPERTLPYEYVKDGPYDAVVIGSLSLSQALRLRDERILQALADGKPVVLYTPGLPSAPANRALSAALAASRREMKSFGILFTDGAQRQLITAREARELKAAGKFPGAGAVLTPLAREILEQ
jgi:3-oxoacyl-[acyl-carrier-protein] synthase III